MFDALENQHHEQADQTVGMNLDWRRLPDKKESHIELYYDCDPSNKSDWSKQFEWLSNAIEKLFHDDSLHHLFVVDKKIKPDLRQLLREQHGIWRGTLFPDSAGAAETARKRHF